MGIEIRKRIPVTQSLDRVTLTLQQHSQAQRLLDEDVRILALRPMNFDRHPKTVLTMDSRVRKSGGPLLACTHWERYCFEASIWRSLSIDQPSGFRCSGLSRDHHWGLTGFIPNRVSLGAIRCSYSRHLAAPPSVGSVILTRD